MPASAAFVDYHSMPEKMQVRGFPEPTVVREWARDRVQKWASEPVPAVVAEPGRNLSPWARCNPKGTNGHFRSSTANP